MDTRVTDVAVRICVTQEEGEVDDLSLVTLRHERGGISSVQMGWVFEVGKGILEVHGSEGSITQGEGGSVLLCRKQTGQWETYFEPDKKPRFCFTYSGSFLNFVSALQADRQPEVGLEAALHNLAIIMAAYESERIGSAISVTTLEHRMFAAAVLGA